MRHVRILLLPAALLLFQFAIAAHATQMTSASAARFYVLRVDSGQDLRRELLRFAQAHQLRAGFIAASTGSVACAAVQPANQNGSTVRTGHYDIVSLTGTLEQGGMHVQAAFADSAGSTFSGRLMDGTTVFTSAELVIGELTQLSFGREPDPKTGYQRLVVKQR